MTNRPARLAPALPLLLLAALGLSRPAAPAPPPARIETLGELPVSFYDRYGSGLAFARPDRGRAALRAIGPDSLLRFSPDGLHLAYVDATPGGATVVVDGMRGREYASVRRCAFSEEDGHLAYFARTAAGSVPVLVLDGVEQPLPPDVDEVEENSLLLSRDGRRFAYVAARRSTFRPWRSVITERGALGPYEQADSILFTRDGRLLFWARIAFDWRIVEDGREGPRFDSFEAIGMDEWHRHAACRAVERGRLSFCRDGTCSSRDPEFLQERYSRDDRHHAELLLTTRGRVLRVDGRDGEPWQQVVLDTTLFSYSGDRCAYWARNAGTWTLVLDGTRACEGIESPGPIRYSPAADRVAWWGRQRSEWILFADGVPVWRQSEPPDWTAFTGDGRHVAHLQTWRNASRLVIDSLAGPSYRWIDAPRLGSTGRVAYLAVDARLVRVVTDGAEGPTFRRCSPPVFSLDGAHVAYAAWSSSDRVRVVLDGEAGQEFEALIPGGPVFRPDGTLEYVTLRRGDLLRVRHDPVPPQAP